MSALRGHRVLVTRPRHQSGALQTALAARGAQAVELPLFVIEPMVTGHDGRLALAAARDWDGWIFTSANAAVIAAELDQGAWPALLAVGAATARTLHRSGHGGARVPVGGSSSEALLDLPELAAVNGQRFLLCTGVGGRDQIESTLRARGARVQRLDLYRRVAVEYAPAVVAQALATSDASIVTSAEGLHRLAQLTPPEQLGELHARPVVVPSARVLELARMMGFAAAHAPSEMSDGALVACLEHAFELTHCP